MSNITESLERIGKRLRELGGTNISTAVGGTTLYFTAYPTWDTTLDLTDDGIQGELILLDSYSIPNARLASVNYKYETESGEQISTLGTPIPLGEGDETIEEADIKLAGKIYRAIERIRALEPFVKPEPIGADESTVETLSLPERLAKAKQVRDQHKKEVTHTIRDMVTAVLSERLPDAIESGESVLEKTWLLADIDEELWGPFKELKRTSARNWVKATFLEDVFRPYIFQLEFTTQGQLHPLKPGYEAQVGIRVTLMD